MGVTTTPDPVRTAVLDLDLEPAAAGALARLLANHLGWSGLRRDLAAALNLSDAGLRVILEVLEARRLVTRERFNIEGRWWYALAVTDTPGRLPTRDELRAVFRDGGHLTWTDANEAVTPARTAARSRVSTVVPTCEDTMNAQVSPCAENTPVNRFPLAAADPRSGRTAAEEPVNRLVPESEEVRAHGTRSRSVIASMPELEALAKMRGAKCTDGGKFRTSREVRDIAQTLDQNVVDEGLALLASLALPFWVGPEVWVLLLDGWSPDRVAALLDGVGAARSPHSAARYRLALAAERRGVPAAAEMPAPPTLDALVERDATHTTPSWGEQAETVDEADTHPDAAPWDRPVARGAYGGFRSPAVPDSTPYTDLLRSQAAIRAESGGGVAEPVSARNALAEIKAMNAAGRERYRKSLVR
ncbi:hypothetical protein [Streptomyces sp. NPDC088739]|uniref:hypothetical protein n=1 Tax=Streptomyces sp. NPDC088739 TaxID=3365882 RepID=UPI0038043873